MYRIKSGFSIAVLVYVSGFANRSRIVKEHTIYGLSRCGQLTTTAVGSLPLACQFIGEFPCAGSMGYPGCHVARCQCCRVCFDTRFLGVLPPSRFCVRCTSGSRPARIDMIGIAPWGASGACRADIVTSFPGAVVSVPVVCCAISIPHLSLSVN